jgi:hypothetical protein
VSITVVRSVGGPQERGLAVGRALAEPIARSVEFYRGFMERRDIGTEDLPRLLGLHREAARAALPELVAELDAADGNPCSAPFEEIEGALR